MRVIDPQDPPEAAPGFPVELPGGTVYRSDDLDVYRAGVNSVFYPARLDLVSPRTHLTHARLSAVQLSHLTLGIVHFGAEVLIDPGDVGGYHINIPLSGAVDSRCGAQQTIVTPGHAAVFTPNEHTILPSWSADATQICIKIDRGTLETELTHILGRPLDRRVKFDIALDLTTPPGRRWWSTLQILVDTINDPGPIPSRVLAAQVDHLERALITGLLLNHRNSLTEALHTDDTPENPRALQKVVELIENTPGAQHTITDLARVSGVGARQLQKLFRDRYDMSPSVYVRNVRLARVRSDLLTATDDTATVSDIAYRWGFNHLGRFARFYQQKFGEPPSHTLRR
ncbi:MAG: AraC family transcriptional regulator [Rhodococcus sp. (in: high G+C Gram-positive bacteria)]|nr:MAG: AraC family transcriptional regulator [Rhodococcus sp. (in: high G+C Gram-positive bacteria)]